ncbi:MAG: 6-phosphogluconolactonase [Bacteroidetes bacterium]|nr:MAG: 6-phosphogluconolactonase [Bacteroidota bacterium]
MDAPYRLKVFANSDELSKAAAQWIASDIASTLAERDRYTIALSGGSTPKKLHELLAGAPFKDSIAWNKMHVFWGDERAVPFEDDRNNAKMAYDTLLDHVPIPPSQIHIMRTDIAPEQSAIEYEKILHRYFPSLESKSDFSFDLVILGMGDDGHTLSLFPGTKAVHEEKSWAIAFYLQAQNMFRITLTKTIVNRSSCILFLATGSNKAHALKEVLEGNYNPDKYPSQVIRPVDGKVFWFVDEPAAEGLSVSRKGAK